MVTLSQIEGYWNGRPRIDMELIEQYGNNMVALSGSQYGDIAQMVTGGKSDEEIVERIEFWRGVFGPENYFLEIEEHPDKPFQPRINDALVRIAKNYNYDLVGTNNTYYLTPEDAEVQDMMAAVAAGRDIDDPERPTIIE